LATLHTNNLTFNSSGKVTLTNLNAGTLNIGASAGGSIIVKSPGTINTTGAITAPGSILLQATGPLLGAGSIIVGNSISSTGLKILVTLPAFGTGSINDASAVGADSISATSILLNAAGGGIGDSSPLRVRAATLTPRSTHTEGFNNLGLGVSNFTLTGATPTGAFTLISANNIIDSSSLLNVTSANISTNANNANITINASLGGALHTQTVTVAANGSGTISGKGIITAVLGPASVSLSSTTGSIGGLTPAVVNSPNVTIQTGGSGIVNAKDSDLSAVSIAPATS